jgi:hypothetical protein
VFAGSDDFSPYTSNYKWVAMSAGSDTTTVPFYGDATINAYRVYAVQGIWYSQLTTQDITVNGYPAITDFNVTDNGSPNYYASASWTIPNGWSPDYLLMQSDNGEGNWGEIQKQFKLDDVYVVSRSISQYREIIAFETEQFRIKYYIGGKESELSNTDSINYN